MERIFIVPLRKARRGTKEKFASKAMRYLKNFVMRHMKSDSVIIGSELNEYVWTNGMRNPPRRVEVKAKVTDGVAFTNLSSVTGKAWTEFLNRNKEEEKKGKKKAEKKEETKAPKKETKKSAKKGKTTKKDTKKKAVKKTEKKETKPPQKKAKKKAPAKATAKKDEKKTPKKKKSAAKKAPAKKAPKKKASKAKK